MSTGITASVSSAAPPVLPVLPVQSASSPVAAAAQPAVASSSGGLAPRPSPVSLLDPSTGLVVLEFYNAKGVETESLPTRKQLESYRLNEPSYSVFQPAIRDGTVPVSTASVSVGSTTDHAVSGTSAAQASAGTLASGGVAAVAALASQTAVAASGNAGSLKTEA